MPSSQHGKGRDHNPFVFTNGLCGGGIEGGVTHGESDPWSYKLLDRTSPTTVYDIPATILHQLGLDHPRLTFRHNGIDRHLTAVHGHVIKPRIACAVAHRPSARRGRSVRKTRTRRKSICAPASAVQRDRQMSSSRAKWSVVALAFFVPLVFAAFTHHAWEDYFITLRASRNLVDGHGLVFTPGERLHTFTSPLGTLLPALCTLVAGPDREELALWLFRGLSAGLLAGAAALLWRRFDTLGLGALGRFVFFGLVLADAKLTDFSINGMETAILVFFVALLWTELEAPAGPRTTRLALAFGGLMWTRPDAFILAAALLGPHVLFRRNAVAPSTVSWAPLWRGALLGGLLYLPWFAWAWWYYGSPVPHTIVAKSAVTPPAHLLDLALVPLRILSGKIFTGNLFLPTYAEFGGWPALVWFFARSLTLVAVFVWLAPRLSAVARRLSFTVFLGTFYLCSIVLFPWYVPPWTLLAGLALAFAVDTLYRHPTVGARPAAASAIRIVCVLAVVVQGAILACVAWQMRVQQLVVENGARRPVGEWLRAHAAPGDTVFLEPLGYIGYFSRLKTYDFPGLSSSEVVRAVRAGARNYPAVIAQLRPQWLVLRPYELIRPEFLENPVLNDYRFVALHGVNGQLAAIPFLPGRRWNDFEAQYYVFRRKAPPP